MTLKEFSHEARTLITRMRRAAEDRRSLAAYQDKLGNLDARTALIAAALDLEMYADRLDKLLVGGILSRE